VRRLLDGGAVPGRRRRVLLGNDRRQPNLGCRLHFFGVHAVENILGVSEIKLGGLLEDVLADFALRLGAARVEGRHHQIDVTGWNAAFASHLDDGVVGVFPLRHQHGHFLKGLGQALLGLLAQPTHCHL